MSKKKKFKKFHRSQILEQIEKSEGDVKNIKNSKIINEMQKISPDIKINATDSKEVAYARKDLKKVAIIFGIILLLLLGATYLNKNTETFNNLSDKLVQLLNIE